MNNIAKSSKKILIVKIGAIGDVVMALSMLNAIDQKYPGAEITWLCGTIVEPLLKCFPRINKIISLNEKKLLTGNPFQIFFEIMMTWFKFFLKKYDLTIVAYRDPLYKILTWFTFKKSVRDFTGRNRLNSFVPGRYHAAEYAKLIIGKDDWQMDEIGFPEIHLAPNKQIDYELTLLKGKRIILNPGGAKNLINGGELRRWPVECYKSLAEKLVKQNYSIILIGSQQDNWVLNHFKDLPVKTFIGKTSLTDLIYLFNQCDILVSHDTGAFHLAKLTSIRIIGLFGPVNPLERTGARENVDIVFTGEKLPCSPCYDGKNFADCNNNICLKDISAELVYNKVIKN